MLKLRNCSSILRNNFSLNNQQQQQWLNALWTLQRQQSTAAATVAPATPPATPLEHDHNVAAAANMEWNSAKPFHQIPTINTLVFLSRFLPGGKYSKLDSTKLLLAIKEDLSSVVLMPGFFGREQTVITYNVEDFEKVLRNEGIWPHRPGSEALHYHRHVHRADFFQGIEGLISTQGETWGKFRTVVNPVMMQPKNVRLYLGKMSQVNKEFVERIRQIRDQQTLEVPDTFEEEINRWTLESVSVVALDKQLGLINKKRDNPMAKQLFQALNDFFVYSLDIEIKPSIWKYYQTATFKKLMKALDTIFEITNTYVNEAIARIEQQRQDGVPEKPEHEKSVLEKLITIDRKIATVMAMDMLMAGVDTTSTTFSGLLLSLAKNPEKQEKLRQEVLRILPQKDSEFDENSVKNMPYLRACIKESLRCYPLAVGNARVVANDVVVSGYQVPKGTQVTMCSVGLMRDKNHYPRADEYLPERWLRTAKDTETDNSGECPHALKPSSPFLYLPFGFGARSCIGRRIVEMELELGIARIIRNYRIEFNYSTENAFKSLLINVPNIPLKFKFSDVDY